MHNVSAVFCSTGLVKSQLAVLSVVIKMNRAIILASFHITSFYWCTGTISRYRVIMMLMCSTYKHIIHSFLPEMCFKRMMIALIKHEWESVRNFLGSLVHLVCAYLSNSAYISIFFYVSRIIFLFRRPCQLRLETILGGL